MQNIKQNTAKKQSPFINRPTGNVPSSKDPFTPRR